MVPAIFGSWAEDLVHAGRCKHGDRVLDVACGTGVVARLDYAFEAFTGDVMQHICIEKPESLLNSDDFSSEW